MQIDSVTAAVQIMAKEVVRICAAREVNAAKCYYALGKQDSKKGFEFPGKYLCGAPSCQKLGGHGVNSRAKPAGQAEGHGGSGSGSA